MEMEYPPPINPNNNPPPPIKPPIDDEETRKLIEQEGYIITENKFEGALKGKEIVVYTAKVVLKSREGTPIMVELKGGTGLSREEMIKMIKLVQSYASHISISEMDILLSGKTFGLNTQVSEENPGKIGLKVWDPLKKEMFHVAATSQWYGSAPGMTLHSTKDKEKFYYFVFDLNELTPLLPEEENKISAQLSRGIYQVLSPRVGEKAGSLITSIFPSTAKWIVTQQDSIKRVNDTWQKIHASEDFEARQQLEDDWLDVTQEGIKVGGRDVLPLPPTKKDPVERKAQLQEELGKCVFAFAAKRDRLKNMREAQSPTMKQSLFVPDRLGHKRTEALKKYGASKLQQDLNAELYLLRQQIQALQMELAAEQLRPEGDAPQALKELVEKYPDLPEQLRAASQQQQKLIKEAQEEQKLIKEAQEEQDFNKRQVIYQKLDLLEQIQRQRILFFEIALDEKARKGKSFFEGEATAIPRLNVLYNQQQVLQWDNLHFPSIQMHIDNNRVTPLEMEYGYVQNLSGGKGVAMGSFEELLGISTTKFLNDYKKQRRSEQIIVERLD